MLENFKAHLTKFIDLGNEEFEAISSYFQTIEVKKKEHLLKEGQVCRYNYFVLQGCIRKYFINEKGAEQTTEFAIENWWMTDIFAFQAGKESQFCIQSVESSVLLQIGKQEQQRLLDEHPIMEKYFRCVYQKAFAASQMRFKYLFGYSREELYIQFRDSYPEFLQRIPQYLLASFLGFTPEYLSEIRKKNLS